MKQFMSVTEARANFRALVDAVVNGGEQIVLLRESKPAVVMMSYKEAQTFKKRTEQEWEEAWKELRKEGKKIGKRLAKQRGINLKTATEEELYDLVASI